MPTVGELFKELVTGLEEMYPEQEAISIMQVVFREKLGFTKTDLALRSQQEIDEKQRKLLSAIAAKLVEGQPVQQIVGTVDFGKIRLRVNKHVLIPRPETEELVSLIAKRHHHQKELHVLDVGTGSGCIAISLVGELPESFVTGIDISQRALELAQINVISNAREVELVNLDILKEDNWKRLADYDLIVSNPPYVPESEKAAMHKNVLEHEPHQALFVPDEDPLVFYRQIGQMAMKHLARGGYLYFELHEKYGKQVKSLLEKLGFSHVELLQDLHGKNRFATARR